MSSKSRKLKKEKQRREKYYDKYIPLKVDLTPGKVRIPTKEASKAGVSMGSTIGTVVGRDIQYTRQAFKNPIRRRRR
jgi:hypothetical protein